MKKILAILCLFILSTPSFAAGVGYINYDKVAAEYQFAKSSMREIETKGREIENYVPINIIKSSLNINSEIQFKEFDDIKQVLNSLENELGEKFESNKFNYARRFIKDMNIGDCNNILDLDSNMKKVIKLIKEWN